MNDDELCESCGRLLTSWPTLGNDGSRRCEAMASHQCGESTYCGPCILPWGHSPYATKHRGRDAQ